MTMQTLDVQAANRDALAERLFGAVLPTMDLFAVYLGNRLGYYTVLAAH